jgi:alpha-galactosidase
MMRRTVLAVACGMAGTSTAVSAASAQLPPAAQRPPSNGAAAVTITTTATGARVRLDYDGGTIFDGTISGVDGLTTRQALVDSTGGRVTQVLKWTSFSRSRLVLRGQVRAGDESFPAQADRPEDELTVVRHSLGLSHSRLNRAVYDRTRDWVLSVDFPARTRVTPLDSGASGITFEVEASGQEVSLRFRPHFYQRHRGLAYFEPWRYRVRRDVPIGWTSWFAFFDKVTEADIKRTADMMAVRLAPWGYRVLQLDDGYQQLPIGVPEHWLTPNAKFPSGMAALARYELAKGLTPAIWTNVAFADAPWAQANPSYFLPDSAGAPVRGNWVGYAMDGANPKTFPDLMQPVYRGLRDMGYAYFKLDALRHLRYEGYNSNASAFASRHVDREAVFRQLVQQVRATIGTSAFLLACWGARPELIGLVDAVRIGDDGFGYGGLAQYNSFNNVVWRNDPDHIELSKPDAYAAITATTLTGSHLMLTDKPEFYASPRSELARRAAPVPFTVPGQLFDVDPSRSMHINDAATELSGAGPRPFDADQAKVTDLYLLDVNRPFERWTVLGRTGGAPRRLAFHELGLADSTDYLVYEAWTHRFLGVQRGSLTLGAIDAAIGAEAVCIRERVAHPQVLATSRHVTCGALDLHDVDWRDGALRGASDLVAGDPYDVVIHEPADARLRDVVVDGAAVVSNVKRGAVRTVRLQVSASARVSWRVRYVVSNNRPTTR